MIYTITFKNTTFKEIKVKNIDSENIYKKCGYKSNHNFKKFYEWDLSSNIIELWSKEDNNVKCFNNHPLLVKYNIKININNKCIFLLKNSTNYINLDSATFSAFFNLQHALEFNRNENTDLDISEENIDDTHYDEFKHTENFPLKEILNTDKHISDELESDTHSELSYELYSYSDE